MFLIDVIYSTTFPVNAQGDGFCRYRISDPSVTNARLTACQWTEHTFGRHAIADIVTDWKED